MDRDLIHTLVSIRLATIEFCVQSEDFDDWAVCRKIQDLNEFLLDVLDYEGFAVWPFPDEIQRRIDAVNDVMQLRRVSK